MSSNASLSLTGLSFQAHDEMELFFKTSDTDCLASSRSSSTCTTEVGDIVESITDSDDLAFSRTLADIDLTEDLCQVGYFGFNATAHNDVNEVATNDDTGAMAEFNSKEDWDCLEKLLKQRRGAQRSSKKLRRYLRPDRVRMQPQSLAKVPNAADVAEMVAAVAAGAAVEKNVHEKEDNAVRSRPFLRMREEFLEKHGETLRAHFCCDVDRVKLAKAIEDRFLSLMRAGGSSVADLILAYHGTKATNFTSIFKKGFLIGGRTTPVVNGTAYGHGVYVGSANNPALPIGYCSDDRLIICAVIDGGCEAQEHVFVERANVKHCKTSETQDESYWTAILRIGRPRKRPSGVERESARTESIAPVKYHNGFMVVPTSTQVVPIGTIKTDKYKPRGKHGKTKPPMPPQGECPDDKTQPTSKKIEDVYWPSEGNPNTTDTLQARSPASRHTVGICRRARCRARQRRMSEGRRAKAAWLWEFENT